jgi:hypothetical protein
MACMQSLSWVRTPLTPAEAIDRARGIARARGWSWVGAVRVSATLLAATFGPRTYEVMSNAGGRGANVRVVVDIDSGEVLDAVYFER